MFRKCLAEFIGTFWLVLGGCGSAVLAARFPEVGIGLAGVALAFGLTVLTAAWRPARSGRPRSARASAVPCRHWRGRQGCLRPALPAGQLRTVSRPWFANLP